MSLPPPKFIPIAKGNTSLAFESFRDGGLGAKTPSPALRGKQQPSPGKRSPQAAPAKSPAMTPQSIVATLKDCDGALNDYIVEIADNKIAGKKAVSAYLLTVDDSEAPANKVAVLNGKDIPRPYFDIAEFGEPACVPLTREQAIGDSPITGPAVPHDNKAAHLPFKTPLAVSQSIQRAVREAAAKEEADGDAEGKSVGAPGELPPMELPPSQDTESGIKSTPERNAPVSRFQTEKLVCVFYGNKDDAEKAVAILEAAFPAAEIRMTPRRRSALNSTLVVKGLPYQTKVDILGQHIATNLSIAPSYIRTHRNERGVFKCVLFIKFASRAKAELAKTELERMNVGSHPLRVEYKKPQKDANPSSNAGPTPSAHLHLEQSVQTLCSSTENEGLSFDPQHFGHEAIRYMAHLCIARDLTLDLVPFANLPHLTAVEQHTPGKAFVIRRNAGGSHHATPSRAAPATPAATSSGRNLSTQNTPSLGPKSSGSATPSGLGIMDRGMIPPSPAMPPSATPVDPNNQSWSTATPSSLKPMEFRGIRHWKEARQQQNVAETAPATGPTLGILRPNGPGSGPAFSSGRGRPVQA